MLASSSMGCSTSRPVVTLAYPLYASVKAIETKSPVDDQQWLTYWVLYSFLTLFVLTLARVIEWLPFWSYAKLAFNCWLVLPYFNGAAYVYQHFVRPLLVNQQIINIWPLARKKDDFSRPDDVLLAAERYIEANGLEAFEELVSKDELMSNEELFFGLTQGLRKFPKETDKVLCHFCFKPRKVTEEVLKPVNGRKSQMLISDIIVLKTSLDAMPFLSKVLKDAKCSLLCNIYRTICENQKYSNMRKRIRDVIDEDVIHVRAPFVACTQQCFAIKAGIDGLLDAAQCSFCDTSEAIHSLANKYREEFNLPNLKIPYNNRQGFYFSIPQKDISGKLPNTFIQVMKHGKNIHCSSFELASIADGMTVEVGTVNLLEEYVYKHTSKYTSS